MDTNALKIGYTEVFQIRAVEIPQYISVKTRFITKQASTMLESSCKLFSLDDETPPIQPAQPMNNPQPKPVLLNAIVKNGPQNNKYKDASTITNTPNVLQSQGVQTDEPEKRHFTSIAIQCNIDVEQENGNNSFNGMTEAENEQQTENSNTKSPKEAFDEFVQSNTYRYNNGKIECLLCGEIGKKKSTTLHMAAHYKPMRVCAKCGTIPMFRKHKCTASNNSTRRRYKCPHYDCGVFAISLLELYDHINEHSIVKTYKCQNHCKRVFTTASEYVHHLQAKNVTVGQRSKTKYNLNDGQDRMYRVRVFPVYSINRKRVFVESFLSIREKRKYRRQLRCQICLKSFKSSFKCTNHLRQCRRIYIERKKRSMSKVHAVEDPLAITEQSVTIN